MSTTLRLFRFGRPYLGLFVAGLLATLLASVLDGFTVVMLVPLLKTLFGTAGALSTATRLESVVDQVLSPLIAGLPAGAAATRIVMVLVLGLLLKNTLAYASNQWSVAVQEGLVRDLRSRLFTHLLGLDLGFFLRTRAGQLINGIISDADGVKTAVSASLASLFQNVVLILTSIVLLATISWRLTLVTLAMAPILVGGIQLLLRRLRAHSRWWAEARGELTSTVSERLGAMKLIRAYGGEAREAGAFARQAERYRKGAVRVQRFTSLTSPVSEVFGGLVVVLVIIAASNPAFTGGPMSAPVTIAFLMLALRIMSPIKSIANFPTAMAVALASAERVFALLDEPLVEVDAPEARAATFAQSLVFDSVTFGYDAGTRVLDDVSFTVAKGEVVAVVGPSGAGKTTLLELLPRFRDPQRGRLLLDGQPLPDLTRESIRALLGVVSQDTVLLNDTVHANIAYGRPEATREEVEAAARAANADVFIAQLPERYETLLGERGTRLSGGQRQRIAIARALLRDPPILLLDEATSALDAESEQLVQQAIDRLMADRTVLVIAHRLATVRHADRIIVLDRGRVVEQGTHDQLLARNGLYRRLHDLQFDVPALA